MTKNSFPFKKSEGSWLNFFTQFTHLHLDFPDKKFLSSTSWTLISDKLYLTSFPYIPNNLQIPNPNHTRI
jgi:hypothetical protein